MTIGSAANPTLQFDVPLAFFDKVDRPKPEGDLVTQMWTLPYVPGPKFGGTKPIWVLTGPATFSGGEDLAFSLQVNADPNIPNSNQDAMRFIDHWEVTDPHTVVVTWNQSYPFADRMEHRDLYPLPKHLLEQSYTSGP